MTNEQVLIIILIILNLLSFVIGLVLGRLWSMSGVSTLVDKPKSFLKESKNQIKSAVSIDETVFVTDIKTDNMIKKYDSLGEIKTSNENISTSVDKLKKMKG